MGLARPTFYENPVNSADDTAIVESMAKHMQEGRDEQSAQLIDHFKKGDMAKEAERLAGTGWLPELLRTPATAGLHTASQADGNADEVSSLALPAFLVGGEPGPAVEAETEAHAIAAE